MTTANRTCTVEGCEGKHWAKGWCKRHYKNNYDHGSPLLCRVKGTDPCTIDGCNVRASAKGLCPKHYLAEYNRATFAERKRSKRAYYEQNRDAFLDRAQRHGALSRSSEPEKHRERARVYRLANPDKRRANQERRRARLTGADIRHLTERDWMHLVRRFNHRCAYCGELRPLSQDHVIPLSRGGRHAIGNLLPACRSCNASKGNRFLVEWRQSIRRQAAQT